MRRFLAAILALVMLTPSLACAMPVCDDALPVIAADHPCPGHRQQDSKGETPHSKITLMKDCMKVELQAADAVLVAAPDMQVDPLFIAPAPPAVITAVAHGESAGNRGPPPDRTPPPASRPDLLLSTQRLRI
ncbi:MAG: hypothetical protein HYU57_03620 [Micavibrio aeruginosavorus]|nr:hypothetical protein [Micavibrio aeruginosavorus]